MFSPTQIAVSTLVGLILSFIVIALFARWSGHQLTISDTLLVAGTVGVSILLWREAGNTPILNEDPIPLVSPNDVLCPVLSYVSLGLLAAFRPRIDGPHWPRLRAFLTLLSLLVNIATI
jgi:hypothetical protein